MQSVTTLMRNFITKLNYTMLKQEYDKNNENTKKLKKVTMNCKNIRINNSLKLNFTFE